MERAGPIARADQSVDLSEPQGAGRDGQGQVPGGIQRPGVRVMQGDAIARRGREDQRMTGNQANGPRRCLKGRPSPGRQLRGIALCVGGGRCHHGLVREAVHKGRRRRPGPGCRS